MYQKLSQNPVEPRDRPRKRKRRSCVLAGRGGAAEEEHGPGALWGLVVEPGAGAGTMTQSPMTPLQDH